MSTKTKIEQDIIENVVENTLPDYSDLSAEEAAEQIRKGRKKLKQRYTLPSSTRPGFRRRLVTIKPGEVEKRLSEGYAPVKGKDQMIFDKGTQTASQMGDVCTMVINSTHGHKLPTQGILMEIPESVYIERQLEKEQENKAIEAMYKPQSKKEAEASADNSDNPRKNFYGEMTMTMDK